MLRERSGKTYCLTCNPTAFEAPNYALLLPPKSERVWSQEVSQLMKLLNTLCPRSSVSR